MNGGETLPGFLPYIPETVTVHLGPPGSNASNVTVPFADYIKNVASSEVYPTWPEAALRANILAQISFTLNRIYTEYYRSRGYPFDITNSTAYDQYFVNGRSYFSNISRLVDELFNDSTEVFAKTSFSCFGEAAFSGVMDVESRPVMIIAGIESHVCVAQTALDALNAGFKVFIAADAVSSRKSSDVETALKMLRHAGCTIASAEAILFMLLRSAKNPHFKAISKLVR